MSLKTQAYRPIDVVVYAGAVTATLVVLAGIALAQTYSSHMGPYDIQTGTVMDPAQSPPRCDPNTSGCIDADVDELSDGNSFFWAMKVGMLTLSYVGDAPESTCTAVQVSSDAIMTAAHCLHLKDRTGAELQIRQATYTNKYQGVIADGRNSAAYVNVEPRAFPWHGTSDLQTIPQETRYGEHDLDVALLKLETEQPSLSNVYIFRYAPPDPIRVVEMFQHRSGGPKIVTRCNLEPGGTSPSVLFTNCVTDQGSSGAPLFTNWEAAGGEPTKVLVGIHAGSLISTHRVTSVAHPIAEIVNQANPPGGRIGILQLAGIKALVEYAKSETGNNQAPNLEQLSRRLRIAQLQTLISSWQPTSRPSHEALVFARSLGGPATRTTLENELGKIQAEQLADEANEDSTLPGFMPPSGAVYEPALRPSDAPKVSRFVTKNFDLKPGNSLDWVPSDMRIARAPVEQVWMEEAISGQMGTALKPTYNATSKLRIRALPGGVWERHYWRREEEKRLGSPSLICTDEHGVDYVPAGSAFFVWFERYRFAQHMSRPANSHRKCLVASDSERAANPVVHKDPGDGQPTHWAEARITHVADLPTSEVNGMLPALCSPTVPDSDPNTDEHPAPNRCDQFSHYRFVRFKDEFSDGVPQPIRRTFEILTVKRLHEDPANPGLIQLRLITCEVHPKINTWPIEWPDPNEVQAENCGSSSITDHVLPHVVEQQYKIGTGVICEKDTVRDRDFVTVTRRWLSGIANENCLKHSS